MAVIMHTFPRQRVPVAVVLDICLPTQGLEEEGEDMPPLQDTALFIMDTVVMEGAHSTQVVRSTQAHSTQAMGGIMAMAAVYHIHMQSMAGMEATVALEAFRRMEPLPEELPQLPAMYILLVVSQEVLLLPRPEEHHLPLVGPQPQDLQVLPRRKRKHTMRLRRCGGGLAGSNFPTTSPHRRYQRSRVPSWRLQWQANNSLNGARH